MGLPPMDDYHDLHVMLTHQGHMFQNGTKSAAALCSRARSLGASTFRFSWQLILSLHGNLKERT